MRHDPPWQVRPWVLDAQSRRQKIGIELDCVKCDQVLTDAALGRRLERAEGLSNVAFVEARARLFPDSMATRMSAAGAWAMFDGAASPLTQTFGLGMFDPVTADDMERVEDFFKSRGAPVCHEVSPLGDPALLGVLTGRGYQPIELTSVLHQPLAARRDPVPEREDLGVRIAAPDEYDLWARTAALGWSEFAEFANVIRDLSMVSAHCQGTVSFLAEIEGAPVATGALSVRDGVGLLAGASTIPSARGRGAQQALLAARLNHAAALGCDRAMMCAQPGSASQRNAERHGFRIAYTRIKWRLAEER